MSVVFVRAAAFASAFLLSSVALACSAHDTQSASNRSQAHEAMAAASSPALDPIMTAGHADTGHATLGDITVEGAWVRAMLPNQPVAGGFLTITNGGGTADRIIKATSGRAARMELHEMAMDGDVMKMRELADGIAIPAGATIELAPGGLHLMFFEIAERFEDGQSVPVTLTFEKAGDMVLELPVRMMPMSGEGAHKHGG